MHPIASKFALNGAGLSIRIDMPGTDWDCNGLGGCLYMHNI